MNCTCIAFKLSRQNFSRKNFLAVKVERQMQADWIFFAASEAIFVTHHQTTLTNSLRKELCYPQPMPLMKARSDKVSCMGRCPNPSFDILPTAKAGGFRYQQPMLLMKAKSDKVSTAGRCPALFFFTLIQIFEFLHLKCFWQRSYPYRGMHRI